MNGFTQGSCEFCGTDYVPVRPVEWGFPRSKRMLCELCYCYIDVGSRDETGVMRLMMRIARGLGLKPKEQPHA